MTATEPARLPYWIETSDLPLAHPGAPPRLAIVPCPSGGTHLHAALGTLRSQGIETLASLLTPQESGILGLEDEEQLCRESGIRFNALAIPDHSIPDSLEAFRQLVQRLHRDLREGSAVGAHCYAGIGRSPMLLACLLCLEGLSPGEAFDRLSVARGIRVPDTWLQVQWVEHFAANLDDVRNVS
jgi:predicted protein tyrosine phosphatase